MTSFSYRPPHSESVDCNEKNQSQAKIYPNIEGVRAREDMRIEEKGAGSKVGSNIPGS